MSTTNSARKKYTFEHMLRSGAKVVFRPIECTDVQNYKEFFKSLSKTSVHFRFLEIIKDLPKEMVERVCNPDLSREVVIVAEPSGEDKIIGVARLEVETKAKRGEFALVVTDSWQGQGLGEDFLKYLIRFAGNYGLLELHCFVSSDNLKMIALAQKLGFSVKSSDKEVLEMSIYLVDADRAPMA